MELGDASNSLNYTLAGVGWGVNGKKANDMSVYIMFYLIQVRKIPLFKLILRDTC